MRLAGGDRRRTSARIDRIGRGLRAGAGPQRPSAPRTSGQESVHLSQVGRSGTAGRGIGNVVYRAGWSRSACGAIGGPDPDEWQCRDRCGPATLREQDTIPDARFGAVRPKTNQAWARKRSHGTQPLFPIVGAIGPAHGAWHVAGSAPAGVAPAYAGSDDRRWSRASEAIFGFTRDEAVGRSTLDLIVPDDVRPTIEATLRRVHAGEAQSYGINANLRKDGTRIVCQWFNMPIVEAGRVVGSISLAQDVTERERNAQRSREAETTLRLALQAGRMGTWSWLLAEDRCEWSDGHYRLLGLQAGLTSRRTPRGPSACTSTTCLGVQREVRAAQVERREFHCEYRVVRPDGSVLWVEGRGSFQYDDSGAACQHARRHRRHRRASTRRLGAARARARVALSG
jgi:PAS domain S-box-containing protein